MSRWSWPGGKVGPARSGWGVGCLVALPLAVALATAGFNGWRSRQAGDHGALEGWSLAELLEHLRAGGMQFRVVSSDRDGSAGHNAYLSRTEQDWQRLNRLPR